jgi:hypothetical protein
MAGVEVGAQHGDRLKGNLYTVEVGTAGAHKFCAQRSRDRQILAERAGRPSAGFALQVVRKAAW